MDCMRYVEQISIYADNVYINKSKRIRVYTQHMLSIPYKGVSRCSSPQSCLK